MSLKRFLRGIDFSVPDEEMEELDRETKELLGKLKRESKKREKDAEVFIGGSFAKGTLTKSKEYDIDIFVRFNLNLDDLSGHLEKIIRPFRKKFKIQRVHGSRDYFKIWKNRKVTFEIIPVAKIKNPRDERNVTDLSYFHVNYVKRRLKKSLIKELQIAKTFFKANGFYGAESYIQGFSGYSLECLIIYYKNFENMLKSLIKIKKGERLIIDPDRKYKKKTSVFLELNESKLQGPIILIDPTWKERNALAALSYETFQKFQAVASKFLKNPGKKYFEERKMDIDKLKSQARKGKAEFLRIEIKTDRQEGDIAGTKLKKFANFLRENLEKYYKIIKSEFVYEQDKTGVLYLIAKGKKEIIKRGPPINMEKAVIAFKKANGDTFVKSGKIYAKIAVEKNAKVFLKNWSKERNNKKIVKDMGVVYMKID